jgi:hypothetical protein
MSIFLTKDLIIAEGNSRICYNHPFDSSKVLKISKNKYNKFSDNDMEDIYFNYLKNKKVDLSHLTKSYGFIETNLGKALLVDKVIDFNGKISLSFKDYILKSKITEKEDFLVNELKQYIFENTILFLDVHLTNVFCCEYEKGKYKLIIIDGLGTARDKLRLKLYFEFKWYAKYKISKQWNKFIKKYEHIKKSIVK